MEGVVFDGVIFRVDEFTENRAICHTTVYLYPVQDGPISPGDIC